MTKLTRILLISTSSGSRGGGEIYLQRLATGLVAQGLSVTVLMSDHSRMDEFANGVSEKIEVVRKPFQNTYDKKFRFLSETFGSRQISLLRQYISELAPEFVHLNKQNLEDGLDWVRALDGGGLPWVTTIHVTNSMTDLGAKVGAVRDRLLRRQLQRYSPNVITVSEASRATYERFLVQKPLSLIRSIPNGVPAAPRSATNEFRNEWRVSNENFVLGTVARIEEQKNPLFTVRLLSRLPEHVHLVWVGDGRMRIQLEEFASELGVTSRLHIDGWRADARERMSAFDLFLLPSRYEGFPLATLEAMSAGLACVVSAVDGNVEAVAHEQTGLVLPPEKLETWEGALRSLLDDTHRLTEMGMNAEQRYRKLYSLEAMTDQTIDFYNQILATRDE